MAEVIQMPEKNDDGEKKEDFIGKLFKIAEAGQWTAVGNLIEERKKFEDISGQNELHFSFTLLHYACNTGDEKVAFEGAKIVLDAITELGPGYDRFETFINKVDINNRTALEISIEKGHDRVIELLLQNNADVTIKFDKKINKRYHKVLKGVFDNAMYLETDEHDEQNEYLWDIWCDFSLLTGNSRNGNLIETQTLATLLSLPKVKHYEILLHAYIHLFVLAKCNKFHWAIMFSIMSHVIWYLLAAIFLYGAATNDFSSTSARNITDSEDPFSMSWFHAQHWFRLIVFPAFFTVFFIKQVINLALSPRKKSYFWNNGIQLENFGQIIVLGLVCLAGIINMPSGFNYFGIFISGLLIQAQLAKTDKCGLSIQTFRKSFIKLGFVLVFLPMLATFVVLFNILLLPKSVGLLQSFIVGPPRDMARMTGELDFNEVFSKKYTNDNGSEINTNYVIIGNLVFILFILLVGILFQNVLIGLTVTDTEKSQRKATAAHLMTRLEVVNVLESFWLGKHIQYFLQMISCCKNCNKKYLLGEHTEKKRPEGISLQFKYKYKFRKIPFYIKSLLFKNKKMFPNGVDKEEHEDW